jgi:hypothetical protein
MKLSSISRAQLEKAGLTDERVSDVSDFIKICKLNGYEINDYAICFVEQFGWLKGSHRAYRTIDLESFDFNPCKAISDIPKERVDIYSLRYGEGLIPIGEIFTEHLTLMVSSSGALLGGYDDYLCIIGESLEKGIEAIFEPVSYKEVVSLQ